MILKEVSWNILTVWTTNIIICIRFFCCFV